MADVPPFEPEAEPVSEAEVDAVETAPAAAAPASEEVASDSEAAADEAGPVQHDYLDDLRRLQAEFENFRKRTVKQQTDLVDRAAESLVRDLLPVLDIADLARAHGADDQVGNALFDALGKEGLERLDPVGEPFDPSEHDAVMHEPSDGNGEGGDATVLEVMRAGYKWRGRLLRPAMVKVKGG